MVIQLSLSHRFLAAADAESVAQLGVMLERFSDNVQLDINDIDRAAGGAQSRFVDKWSDNSCGFENCGTDFDYVAAKHQLHHLP